MVLQNDSCYLELVQFKSGNARAYFFLHLSCFVYFFFTLIVSLPVFNYYRPDNEVDGCKKLAHFTTWMEKSGVGNNEPLKIMIHDLTHVRLLFVLLFEACLLH